MSRYKPTQAEIKKVIEYAIKAEPYYRSNSRERKEKIKNITMGKLAELSFFSIDGNSTLPADWLTPSELPDPGWDLIRENGNRIQVKLIQEGAKWVEWKSWYWEELAIMKFERGQYELIRILDKKEVNRIAKKSKFQGWYLDVRSIS